jgi:hypothetical protein
MSVLSFAMNLGRFIKCSGLGTSVGIATGYGLDGLGIKSWLGRDCPHQSDWPWGPPGLLYNGYRVFPGGRMRPGHDADPLTPF